MLASDDPDRKSSERPSKRLRRKSDDGIFMGAMNSQKEHTPLPQEHIFIADSVTGTRKSSKKVRP